MEAPEKIYLCPSDLAGIDYDEEWLRLPLDDNSIEYIRKDAFIKKACEYLFENYHGEKLSLKMINDFKKCMED